MDELPTPIKLGYSIREACAATSLGKTTLYSHISAGRLRAVRVGGRTLIPADSLLALVGAPPSSTTSTSLAVDRGRE
jgi:excisionase family DNA binding protein